MCVCASFLLNVTLCIIIIIPVVDNFVAVAVVHVAIVSAWYYSCHALPYVVYRVVAAVASLALFADVDSIQTPFAGFHVTIQAHQIDVPHCPLFDRVDQNCHPVVPILRDYKCIYITTREKKGRGKC